MAKPQALRTAALCIWALIPYSWAMGVEYPGPAPGEARATLDGGRLELRTAAVAGVWKLEGGRLALAEFVDRQSGSKILPAEDAAFAIRFADGRLERASKLRLVGQPRLERVAARPDAVRLAERFAGWKAAVGLVSADGVLQAEWTATVRDQSHYLRQEVTLTGREPARTNSLPQPSHIVMLDLVLPGAEVRGSVDGSPLVAGNWFAACEHPMATARVEGDRAVAEVGLFAPLAAGQRSTRSCVVGVAPSGQMRRAFLGYLERERPRPYGPFLHYNSWYDIAWGDRKMDEKGCLAVIEQYGQELIRRRGVALDSLVFDDGWDDNRTLWGFHAGFARGFAPLAEAAKQYQTAVGVWLSPWGGYGKAKKERLEYGRQEGFETNRRGFSLAGEKYYARFRDACAGMVRQYGVNYFKFDGIAQGSTTTGAGAEYAADVQAMLRLLVELRALRPDLFVNVTTGTWPSPFWLCYGDSIWRSGSDMGFHGPGSKRQQWITYRDMITYRGVVRRGPLFPTSSLMTQGICQARLGSASQLGNDLKEMAAEIRSFFGSGTQCQELYVSPDLLSPAMWNLLAEGARWSRAHADVLADVHWIGGDPGEGQVYGFAAWSPRKGLITLRNPGEQPAGYDLELAAVLELPSEAPRKYQLCSPWKDAPREPLRLSAERRHRLELRPFEVLMFEAEPLRP